MSFKLIDRCGIVVAWIHRLVGRITCWVKTESSVTVQLFGRPGFYISRGSGVKCLPAYCEGKEYLSYTYTRGMN